MATLKDELPHEFMDSEYYAGRAWKFKDTEVTRVVDGTEEGWPGKHRHVMNWYILANGYAVGWNENPAVGWSFPVVKYKENK